MSIRVALHHRTTYRYDRPVNLGPHVIRLRPAPHTGTLIESYSLRVKPAKHFVNWQQDPHGTYLARLVFLEPTVSFEIDVDLVAELGVKNPFDFFLEPDAETVPFEYDASLARDLLQYRRTDPAGPKLRALLAETHQKGRTIDFLVALNQRLHDAINYVIRLEPGVRTPEQTLELRSGSCRDTAWLLVQALRHLGYAARFASGYLIQLEPDVKAVDGPAGADHDFTDLHAWAEIYLPGAGWIGLDPTSGLFAGEGHIPLACTPEPDSAAPVSGMVDDAEVEFGHEMSVTRVKETPRVTKPYTEEQWTRIQAVGQDVDAELEKLDVRLTQGGEPTFVSIDDPDALEWTYGALGARKRERAGLLLRRLAKRFSAGALLHFGQGKWYPGEPLPRWALSCFWRKDGVPVWDDAALLADDQKRYPLTSADSEKFARALAQKLGVNPGYAVAAYEDAFYYMWREQRLPVNVSARDAKLDDEMERRRLARVFEQGLGHVAGYVLPLEPEEPGSRRFRSGPLFKRSEPLFLVPGDSPMGYRLPLASLPWTAKSERKAHVDRDPFETRGPLAARSAVGPVLQDPRTEREKPPAKDESAAGPVRKAICTEIRDARLHVFLPPFEFLEDFLAVIEAVEGTAAQLKLPVLVEGYPPPQDSRLLRFSVTPDPGVIEVNIHPASSWTELSEVTTALYEEARHCRLGTEKFLLDGRHTGTGGGNHLTLGGGTAEDSPFLRRPDLLRSLVGYWHDHPSLSYLFSGLFIGPTSQAPRVDEARHEATYELDIAFRGLDAAMRRSSPPSPWLVDRTFRHLLADMTGNTHRAEFCIDKLYSPDGPTGRLGIVEMRGFEMPPHAQMSLTQQLLVRALVAWFWKTPYEPRLPRWGTSLHDRFLLPHFVARDFADVIKDVNGAGFRIERTWFDVQHEFRFPELGVVSYDNVTLELRRALEPWHVLAEEGSTGGTSRSVDSTLERIQVMVRGAIEGRHALFCNGVPVPLHPTGIREEAVAGIRYRAWALPLSLHPTIPPHAPLVLDLVDLWAGRSIGGCTVNVSHPGGLSYDKFPINSYEAESRRATLFSPFGHTPGPMTGTERALHVERNPDCPLTLDLRAV